MKHLHTRILKYYLSITIIFGITLVLFVIIIFSKQWKEEMNNVILQKMDIVDNSISNKISEIRDVHKNILKDKNINKIINKKYLTLQDRIQLYYYMQNYTEKDASIISCMIVDSNKQILDSRNVNMIYKDFINSNKELSTIKEEKRMSIFSGINGFPRKDENTKYQDKNVITYIGKYYNNDNYNVIGYIVLNWKKYALFSEINKIADSAFENSFIVNENNEILYKQDEMGEEYEGEFIPFYKKQDGNYIVCKKQSSSIVYIKTIDEYPEWRYIGIVSYSQIIAPIIKVCIIVIIIILITIIVTAIITFKISKGITKPIYSVVKSMKKLENGNYPDPIINKAYDETDELIEGFNSMVKNIKKMEKEIIADKEKQKQIEIDIMQSKLDLLQSQINPHFIHNTLNTMRYLAQKDGNKDLSELIKAFNNLLRTSMDIETRYNTVECEVNNLNDYFEIQKQRYDVLMTLNIYIFDKVNMARLPKMIVQPLVENSLFHGIVPKGEGNIDIVFRKEDDCLSISVSDNGIGIPYEKQENITKISNNSLRGYNKVGLKNVNERLILYYGKNSKLNILSSADFGTFIYFKIPYEE